MYTERIEPHKSISLFVVQQDDNGSNLTKLVILLFKHIAIGCVSVLPYFNLC